MTAPVVVLPTAISPESTRSAPALMLCVDPQRAPELEAAGSQLGGQPQVMATAFAIRDYADSHTPPDACVLVTPLPDGPVLPLIRMLRARGWDRLTVLSSKADPRAVHAALRSGVRVVVVRTETDQAVPPPVRPSGRIPLSERELEVLRLVADGQSNRQVGEKLGLSALTVKSHLARIARKLGSGDRAHLVATAIRKGYIR